MILDNYIIRIYRRDKADPRLMVGTVEEIGRKEKKGFNSFEELREILVSAGGRSVRRRKEKPRRESGKDA